MHKFMRKLFIVLLSACLALGMTACEGSDKNDGDKTQTPKSSEAPDTSAKAEATEAAATEAASGEGGDAGSSLLIAYFTIPEDVDISGVDAIAGASVVVRDGEPLGNTEYVAKRLQETVGGDLFRIETVEDYPLDHDPLVDQAAEEQDKSLRPKLAGQIENLQQYDTILLGYPNWWGDLPMPVYSFLEQYDFAGKTIIPFVTHGGSGFSDTCNTIAQLQPNADISDNTLSLARDKVADSEDEVRQWAESLGV